MKLFVKFISFVFVLGFAGLFVLKKPDGQPWLKPNDFMPDVDQMGRDLGNIVEEGKSIVGAEDGGNKEGLQKKLEQMGKTRVFKWTDKYGNMQFSDKPPFNTEGITNLKEVWVDPGVNLMEGLKQLEEEESSAGVTSSLQVPSPSTVPITQVPQLIDDAKQVQQLMNQRGKELEKY